VTGIDRTYGDIMAVLLDISGTSPSILRYLTLRVGGATSIELNVVKLSDNTAYASWLGGGSLGADGLMLRITSDDNIVPLPVADKLESSIETSNGYLDIAVLDSTHVLQMCRNSSSYLSAKVIELAA